MLRHLRKLSPEAKRTTSIFLASVLTLVIAGTWLLYSIGVFQTVYSKTREQGIAFFSFIDQNVEVAYNAFGETFKKSVIIETSTTTATTTEEKSEVLSTKSETNPEKLENE